MEQLPEFPSHVFDVVQQARKGQLRINYQSDTLNRIEHKIAQQSKSSTQAIISSALLISGTILYSQNMLHEAQIVFGLGSASALWLFFKS
jgi:hypothetical protein